MKIVVLTMKNKKPSLKPKYYAKPKPWMYAVIFVLIFVIIGGGYALYQAFAATTKTANIEAESFRVNSHVHRVASASASAGSAMLFRSNTSLSKSITLPEDTVRVIVRAKGTQCDGAPRAVIKIDGTIIAEHSVKSKLWANYTSDQTIGAGSHSLTISFTNNFNKYKGKVRTCTRDLFVDKITFYSDIPEEDPEEWELVYEDNFDGSSVDSTKWNLYNSAGHAGNGLRRPSAFSTDGNGALVITANMNDSDQIVSGGMSSKTATTYGKFEARVRTEADPTGTMSGVALTWPVSNNHLQDGENDFYETGRAVNTRTPFHSFIHWPNSPASNYQTHITHNADGTQWHTMTMEWSADSIKIYRDGEFIGEETDPAKIPDVAHKLCLQLDAFSNSTTLTQPVRMYVDYVKVYSRL